MSVTLLVVGVLLTGAGAAAVGFGISINTLPFGSTLILAGTTAAVGGLLMIGLAAAVAELTQIVKAARMRPSPAPTRAAEPTLAVQPVPEAAARDVAAPEPHRLEPQQAPTSPPDVNVSAFAIERLRSTIPRSGVPEAEEVPLSPNGGHLPVTTPELPTAPSAQPAGGAAVETLRESRLDFLYRSRSAPRPAPPPAFDSVWPERPKREPQLRPEPKVEGLQAPAETPLTASAEPAPAAPGPHPVNVAESPADTARTAAVLKSGVVDGMAYTLYADGSIEAQLPQGTVRFGSIAELRAHIESHS
jgi:hypothetical protein